MGDRGRGGGDMMGLGTVSEKWTGRGRMEGIRKGWVERECLVVVEMDGAWRRTDGMGHVKFGAGRRGGWPTWVLIR